MSHYPTSLNGLAPNHPTPRMTLRLLTLHNYPEAASASLEKWLLKTIIILQQYMQSKMQYVTVLKEEFLQKNVLHMLHIIHV